MIQKSSATYSAHKASGTIADQKERLFSAEWVIDLVL